jgi:hypothetical protein
LIASASISRACKGLPRCVADIRQINPLVIGDQFSIGFHVCVARSRVSTSALVLGKSKFAGLLGPISELDEHFGD